jgi:hypothetical protein
MGLAVWTPASPEDARRLLGEDVAPDLKPLTDAGGRVRLRAWTPIKTDELVTGNRLCELVQRLPGGA